jgi:hypothetical protein
MPELDELLADIDDPQIVEAIKSQFAATQENLTKQQALLQRDLRVRTEPTYAEKFPLAMKALAAGVFNLPDDPSDDALTKALTEREAQMKALGLGVSAAASEPETPADPAAAFGPGDIGTGNNAATALSLLEKAKNAAISGEESDRLAFIEQLQKMNQMGMTQQLDELAEMLGAKYPVGRGPGSRITNQTPLGNTIQRPRRGRPKK